MDAAKAWVAECFTRAAPVYETVVPYFSVFAAAVVAAADPRPGDRALDVGCGAGPCTLPLAEAVGPAGRVLALDLAPGMVEVVAARAAAAGLGAIVEARVADAEAPALEPASVDVAVSSYVWQFLHRPAWAARALAAALAPGGRAVVAVPASHDLTWQHVADLVEVYRPRLTRPVRRPPPPVDPAAELAAAGLEVVDDRMVAHDLLLADADQWWDFSMSHGQRVFLEALGEVDRARFRARAAERLEPYRTPAGIPIHAECRLVVADS